MPIADSSALVAYAITIAGSVIIAKRSSNWRIRLLALTIGFLPLCQSLNLLDTDRLWITHNVEKAAETLELLASALGLTAVYLLNQENQDRKNTDARLRVAELNTTSEESPSRKGVPPNRTSPVENR